MKKYFYMAAALLAAAACAREPIIPEETVDSVQEQNGPIEVTLVAGNPETRTELGLENGSLKPFWSQGDNISVVFIDGDDFEYDDNDRVNYHSFTSSLSERASSAQFTGTVAQYGQYRAFYPANFLSWNEDYEYWDQSGPSLEWKYDDNLGCSLPCVNLNIPTVQYPTAISFDSDADLLVSAPFEIESDGEGEYVVGGSEIPIRFTRPNAIVKVKFNPSGELRTLLEGQKVRKVCFNTVADYQEDMGYADWTRASVVGNDAEQYLYLTGEAQYVLPYIDDLESYDVNEDDRYIIGDGWPTNDYVIARYSDETAYNILSGDSETATYFVVYPSILKNYINEYDGTVEGLPILIETDDYVITREVSLPSGGIALQPSVVTTLNISLTMDNVKYVEQKGISFKREETTLIPGDGEKVMLSANYISFPSNEISTAEDFESYFLTTAKNEQGEDYSDDISLRYVTYEETDNEYRTYVYDDHIEDLFLSVDENIPAGDYELTVTYEGHSATCTIHVITESTPIVFADQTVKTICVDAWGGRLVPGELTEYEASKVTSLSKPDYSSYFKSNANIVSFNELAYFTGLESIMYNAFQGCSNLKSIVIPEGVTQIEYYAFDGCTRLESITLPSSLGSIDEYVFRNCHALESIELPKGLAGIGRYTFSSCDALTSIVLPSTFHSTLPDYAFEYCSSLKTVTILGKVNTIGNYTFRGCSALEEINIPDGTNYIYNYAFVSCTSLKSISIPGSVTTISTAAFYGCSALEEVILNEGVRELSGQNIFRDCTSLHEIVFPASLTRIGNSFYGAGYVFTNVEFRSGTDNEGNEYHGVKFQGSNPPRFENSDIVISGKHWDAGAGDWVNGVDVYVPSGSRAAYEALNNITNSGQNTIIEF